MHKASLLWFLETLDNNLCAQIRIHLNSGTKIPSGGGTHLAICCLLIPYATTTITLKELLFSAVSVTFRVPEHLSSKTSMIFLTNLTSGLLVFPKMLLWKRISVIATCLDRWFPFHYFDLFVIISELFILRRMMKELVSTEKYFAAHGDWGRFF